MNSVESFAQGAQEITGDENLSNFRTLLLRQVLEIEKGLSADDSLFCVFGRATLSNGETSEMSFHESAVDVLSDDGERVRSTVFAEMRKVRAALDVDSLSIDALVFVSRTVFCQRTVGIVYGDSSFIVFGIMRYDGRTIIGNCIASAEVFGIESAPLSPDNPLSRSQALFVERLDSFMREAEIAATR